MAKPELKRKSDGVLISDMSVAWSDWYEIYSAPTLFTVNMVPDEQPIGVMFKACRVKFAFADRYAGSTRAKLDLLINAHRKKQTLTYTDVYGETFDVRVHEIPEPSNRDGARTATTQIKYREVVLRKTALVA